MGGKTPVRDDKMLVTRIDFGSACCIDDPVWLGEHAKKMAREILKKEHRGPGDTIQAAAGRIETSHGLDSNITLQCWNRPPREMLVSRWMAIFRVHHVFVASPSAAYAATRARAVDRGVHPAIVRLADLVAGAGQQETAAPIDGESVHLTQGSAAVEARAAHNREVAGSTPAPATRSPDTE